MRDPGGFSGLDVPWRKQTEAEWEGVLSQPAPACINITHNLLGELGGAEHVAKYGWHVDTGGPHVVLTKTAITVFKSRLADLIDLIVERLVLGAFALSVWAEQLWKQIRGKDATEQAPEGSQEGRANEGQGSHHRE